MRFYASFFRAAEEPVPLRAAIRRRDVDRLIATVWYGRRAVVDPEVPMADKSNDPVAIWQTMIGEMEKGFNAFANQAMTSPEFSRAVNQAGGVAAGGETK